ncbi:hypothetical protein B0H19DRAFT_1269133 [Mycena capillaripes]|nr:hypothetical protein B0H19DRAFT_1269133 [Mycena capillaripes]
MQGAEHPGKVKWTRPFLPLLEPIPALASRQTFVDIADELITSGEPALAQLIELTEHLPLAIRLMASVASFEGPRSAVSLGNRKYSDGYDKRSNLEESISMSLTSPRVKSNPHALDPLSLLSLLPDGISEAELLTSQAPLPEIPQCKLSLIQTSSVHGRRSAEGVEPDP